MPTQPFVLSLLQQSLRSLDALLQAVSEILILATALDVSRDCRTDHFNYSTILDRRDRLQGFGLFC
jgi:hypothetical protein